MKRKLLFLIPVMVLILAACSGNAVKTAAAPVSANAKSNTGGNAAVGNANSLERADGQGSVTVTVTPVNLSNPGETLDFDVSLQTHMVDLSMDIAALSSLKTDTGVTVKAASWDGPKGGHHVKGKLTFPASQDKKSILQGAKTLTLVIQNVDAGQRTFTWELPK